MPWNFLPEENAAIASSNDDIESIGDILAVKGIRVYIIGTDNRWIIIYPYKINRDKRYFNVAEDYKDNLMSLLF